MSSRPKTFFYFIFTILLTLGLSLSLNYLLAAWTPPAGFPPACTSGNPGCDAPLNISNTPQQKAGMLLLNTGGSTNGLIVQSGNVGIGTTGPEAVLDVQSSNPVTMIRAKANGVGKNVVIRADRSDNNAAATLHFGTVGTIPAQWAIGTRSDQGDNLVIDSAGATSTVRMLIDRNTGNVGIGTTAPVRKLSVLATDDIAQFSGSSSLLDITNVVGGGIRLSTDGTGYFGIRTSGTTGGEQLTINSAGNVGIGTASPGARLDVVGNINSQYQKIANLAPAIIFVETDQTGEGAYWRQVVDAKHIRWDSGANPTMSPYNTRFLISYDGNVSGTFGSYHSASDIRLKKEIVTIPNALDKVLALRGVNFKWKNPSQEDDVNFHMGMIAQEVEKVVPEIVHTSDDEMKTKAVEYQYMVGLLVEATKELKTENEALKKRIEILESKQK